MNVIKKYFLRKELLKLESQLTRYYALSTWRTELENNQGNIIQKIWTNHLLTRCNIEYNYLSPKIPSMESRIYEIKSSLRDY